MDRGELAKLLHDVLENDDDSGGGGYLRQADAALAWFRDYLGRDDVVERAARAVDPEIWTDDIPIPTRAGIHSFHARRQRSCVIARAALDAIGGDSADVAAR